MSPSPSTLSGMIAQNQTPPPNPTVQWAAYKTGVMGAINVLTRVLAVRFTLLISVCGAIALAVRALGDPRPFPATILAIYVVVVVLPLVWAAR